MEQQRNARKEILEVTANGTKPFIIMDYINYEGWSIMEAFYSDEERSKYINKVRLKLTKQKLPMPCYLLLKIESVADVIGGI